MGFTREQADLINDTMSDGFRRAGLTVPAAEHLQPKAVDRQEHPDEDKISAAEAKRARKQAARKLLMRRLETPHASHDG